VRIMKENHGVRMPSSTAVEKLKHFVGVYLYIGIVRLPRICDYWSTKPIFGISLVSKIMVRNRFETLLTTTEDDKVVYETFLPSGDADCSCQCLDALHAKE